MTPPELVLVVDPLDDPPDEEPALPDDVDAPPLLDEDGDAPPFASSLPPQATTTATPIPKTMTLPLMMRS